MDVRLFTFFCVLCRQRPLQRADRSSRGVLLCARDQRISISRRLGTGLGFCAGEDGGGCESRGHGHMARCEVLTEVLRKVGGVRRQGMVTWLDVRFLQRYCGKLSVCLILRRLDW